MNGEWKTGSLIQEREEGKGRDDNIRKDSKGRYGMKVFVKRKGIGEGNKKEKERRK